MAYTVRDFNTKKALKEAVEAYNYQQGKNGFNPVRCYQRGLGPDLSNFTGNISLEGPHYPKPHTWYIQAELVNGIVVKVK